MANVKGGDQETFVISDCRWLSHKLSISLCLSAFVAI